MHHNNKYKFEATEVEQALTGRWSGAVVSIAPELSEAVEKIGKHVACPMHPSKDGFRLFDDFNETGMSICNTCGSFNGFKLLQEVTGKSFPEVLELVATQIGMKPNETTPIPYKKKERTPEQKLKSSKKAWRDSSKDDLVISRYYKARGLPFDPKNIPDCIRGHSSLYYGKKDGVTESYPAIVAKITNLNGDFLSLQRIYCPENGESLDPRKKIMSPAEQGGISGGAIHLSEPTDGVLIVAEGFETAQAIAFSTNHAVWSSVNAGGMRTIEIPNNVNTVIIMPDKDKSGTGQDVANDLAVRLRSEGKKVLISEPEDDIPDGSKSVDWLDMFNKYDPEVIQNAIKNAVPFKITENSIQKGYAIDKGYLWKLPPADDPDAIRKCISTAIYIEARTSDIDGNSHGKLLTWTDNGNVKHQFALPLKMLTNKQELASKFWDEGVVFDPDNPKHLDHFIAYIAKSNPSRSITCVSQIGWHGDDNYVLPDETISKTNAEFILQGNNRYQLLTSGTLDEWKENISIYCQYNSRLLLSVATAFAAPLMYFIEDIESGGFHLRGGSSIGKTTSLIVASSVCGSPKFMRSWRATSNGLEAVASGHNYCPLILDEMGQVESKDLGNVIYMIANESGKTRAIKTGGSAPLQIWKTQVLSTGEISLETHMLESGKKCMAGQEARLVDVPADARQGKGIFEDVKDFEPDQLADHLRNASKHYYGVAFREFLKQVVNYIHEHGRDVLIKTLRDSMDKFIKVCPLAIRGK